MSSQRFTRRVFFLPLTLMLAGVGLLCAEDLTPKHPKIVASVERASLFLQREGAREARLGGKALVSMAMLKAGVREDHPLIEQTIKDIRASISSDGTVKFVDHIDTHIYSAGLILLFLSELEGNRYRPEMRTIGHYLYDHQRRDGSWTYLNRGKADDYPSGDMSMTQYCVMGLWTLHRNGVEVPGEPINRIGRWLVSVQNPEGAYAYQTTVSADLRRVSWEGVRLSMSAAGLASLYVCRDLFRYNDEVVPRADAVHEAFKTTPDRDDAFRTVDDYPFTTAKSQFDAAQRRGNAWLERNFDPVKADTEYLYYYFYALERYAAFRELAENKFHESPPWYNKTATFLLDQQKEKGNWEGGGLDTEVNTAYAILLLLRSTRLSFEKWRITRFGGGNLIGGRGLPELTDSIKVEDGRVVSIADMEGADQLIERLAAMDQTDEETLARLAELPADEVENLLKRNRARIKKLVGHQDPEKRLAAVGLLGKSGDVGNAPALIYALTDPDPVVVRAARDALFRLARIPKQDPLPEGDDSDVRRKREQDLDRWKTWYREIDPDVVFEER